MSIWAMAGAALVILGSVLLGFLIGWAYGYNKGIREGQDLHRSRKQLGYPEYPERQESHRERLQKSEDGHMRCVHHNGVLD